MQCKYESCSNEAQGASAYCSSSCRAQHSRRNKSSATQGATLEHQDSAQIRHERHILVDQDKGGTVYAERTNPDSLNYGPSMTAHQLKQAELKANRVPIPGDSDYRGVCVKQDGVSAA